MDDVDAQYQYRDRVDTEMEIASDETGLRLTTALGPNSCREIMEALGLDQDKMDQIHLRLCNAKAHEEFRLLFEGPATATFYDLERIARELEDLSRQLMAPPGNLLTITDVAERCRVSPRTVRRWIDGGQLTVFKFGRAVRVSEDDLRELLEKSRKSR